MWGDPETAYGPTLFSLELVLLYLFYTLGICLITHLGKKKKGSDDRNQLKIYVN